MAEEKLRRVSVIIPVYQVSDYVERCLRSVMNQTYKGIECIIVDDATKDDSIEKCERLLENYSGPIQFKIVHHEKNRGLSAARNTGLRQAEGDYVFFLDSDDEIANNCIELLMERVNAVPSVELVQGRALGKISTKAKKSNVFSNDEVRKAFFRSQSFPVTAWNKLIKRSFLLENNIGFMEGVIFEDTPWMFCLLKCLSKVGFVNDYTYNYYKRADSIVSNAELIERANSFRLIYHYILENFTSGHEKEEFNYYAIRFAYVYAKYSRYALELKGDYLQWKEKAEAMCSFSVRIRLSASLRLEKLKYGWVPFVVWERLKTPFLIPSDLKRLFR